MSHGVTDEVAAIATLTSDTCIPVQHRHHRNLNQSFDAVLSDSPWFFVARTSSTMRRCPLSNRRKSRASLGRSLISTFRARARLNNEIASLAMVAFGIRQWLAVVRPMEAGSGLHTYIGAAPFEPNTVRQGLTLSRVGLLRRNSRLHRSNTRLKSVLVLFLGSKLSWGSSE